MTATKVADGQAATAAQYNALYDDVHDITVGHAHSGDADDGKVIAHSDLSDGAIGSGKTHAQIDTHIGSTVGAGSTGVHGIHASAAVQGTLGTETYPARLIQYGTLSGSGGTVTTTLDTIEGVILTPLIVSQEDWGCVAYVTAMTNSPGGSTFTVYLKVIDYQNPPSVASIAWLAWGTKA